MDSSVQRHFIVHRAMLFLFGATALQAQTLDLFIPPALGSQNLTAGSYVEVQIRQSWGRFYDATVDPGSNLVTVPGHPFKTGAAVMVSSTGKLPVPLTSRRAYNVCVVDANRFSLAKDAFSCATPKVFTTPGTGVLKIVAAENGPKHVYLTNPTGLPPGVSFETWCGTAKCPVANGKPFSWLGASPFTLKLFADPKAPVSSSVVTVTLDSPPIPARSISFPLNVNAPSNSISQFRPTPPTAAPPIPNKDKWESMMLKLAAKWCDRQHPTQQKYAFGVESQVWYYDGALVYYQVADYTGDASWKACAENIAQQFRDYTFQGTPLWRVFTRGLARAYRETGDDRYLKAVQMQATRANTIGGFVRDDYLREAAYALDAQVTYFKLTGDRLPTMTQSAERLMGMFDALFVSNNYVYHQIFMDGLALRSLIEYYQVTKDPKVPPAVKLALDYIWTKAWVPSENKVLVNPDPLGPRCDWGCREPNTELINLYVPAYAWYWALTGDDTYRQRGDVMFSHALDMPIEYSGKIFSQNYTWSFDYIYWRELKKRAAGD